jgi:hypothetical protein
MESPRENDCRSGSAALDQRANFCLGEYCDTPLKNRQIQASHGASGMYNPRLFHAPAGVANARQKGCEQETDEGRRWQENHCEEEGRSEEDDGEEGNDRKEENREEDDE